MAKDFYNLSAGECIKLLNTSKNGILDQERQIRLEKKGFNEIISAPKQSAFKLFLKQFKDVMTIILLIASVISMLISIFSHQTSELVDGFIILGIVFFNAFNSF